MKPHAFHVENRFNDFPSNLFWNLNCKIQCSFDQKLFNLCLFDTLYLNLNPRVSILMVSNSYALQANLNSILYVISILYNHIYIHTDTLHWMGLCIHCVTICVCKWIQRLFFLCSCSSFYFLPHFISQSDSNVSMVISIVSNCEVPLLYTLNLRKFNFRDAIIPVVALKNITGYQITVAESH